MCLLTGRVVPNGKECCVPRCLKHLLTVGADIYTTLLERNASGDALHLSALVFTSNELPSCYRERRAVGEVGL